jgi:hypothetical protein
MIFRELPEIHLFFAFRSRIYAEPGPSKNPSGCAAISAIPNWMGYYVVWCAAP